MAKRTKIVIRRAMVPLVLLAAPAAANEIPTPTGPSRVELRTYGAGRLAADWHGHGAAVMATDLCVASSTGRYRLRVLNMSVGTRDAQLRYHVEFRDGAGRAQIAAFDGMEIAFEGVSPRDVDCSAGSNARLIIRIPEAELLAKSSGQYVDSLRLVADPI